MTWSLSISFILSQSSNSLGTEDTSRAHLQHHSSSLWGAVDGRLRKVEPAVWAPGPAH